MATNLLCLTVPVPVIPTVSVANAAVCEEITISERNVSVLLVDCPEVSLPVIKTCSVDS